MAEAVFAHVVKEKGFEERFEKIDSFGTGAYHLGETADRRSAKVCRDHGIQVNHRAQQIWPHHFEKFDYIIGMDESNYKDLKDMKPKNGKAKVHMFGDFRTDNSFPKVVSDPYYGGSQGFETNFRQVSHFSEQLLKRIIDSN